MVIMKIAAILNFSVVNSDVLALRNIKIHELHVQIDGKIRNLLTFLDFGCHFGSHFENGGHFEIFSAKLDLVMSENVKFMYCMAEFIKK